MISHIKEVVESMKKQAEIRVSGHLPSLDEYIHLRRLTSGIIPAAVLIEFGMGIELPNEVLSHPLMCIILDCTNDFVCLSNVRFHSFIDIWCNFNYPHMIRTCFLTQTNVKPPIRTTC